KPPIWITADALRFLKPPEVYYDRKAIVLHVEVECQKRSRRNIEGSAANANAVITAAGRDLCRYSRAAAADPSHRS
ncbi:MAG: hypothetical protein WBE64_08745, partial [Xanthobacteraceae bacterium]